MLMVKPTTAAMLDLMNSHQTTETIEKAKKLQNWADRLCLGRAAIAIPLGTGVAFAEKQPARKILGIGVGLTWATDKLDGYLSRRAAVLLNKPTTEEGAHKDHLADKALSHSLMVGSAIFALRNRNYLLGTILLTAEVTYGIRDYKMQQARREVAEHETETKAGQWGKGKTAILAIGTTLMALCNSEESAFKVGAGMVVAGLIPAAAAYLEMTDRSPAAEAVDTTIQ